MINVFFKPWVGCNYGTNNSIFNKKILVLGDSHYFEIDSSTCNLKEQAASYENFTTEVITDYLDPEHSARWKSTFTKFMNSLVSDTKHQDRNRYDLWSSIAFYNYLQIAAGEQSRQAHLYDFKKDKYLLAFLEVISILEPDVIISWGNNVWDALPNNLGWGEFIADSKYSDFCFNYPFNNKTIKLIGITHPSTAYKSEYWNNVFTELAINQ